MKQFKIIFVLCSMFHVICAIFEAGKIRVRILQGISLTGADVVASPVIFPSMRESIRSCN